MYILTGGAGFIGSVFLWTLNAMGIEDILIVDNLGTTSKWRNLVKHSYRDYLHRDKFRTLLLRRNLPDDIQGVIHLGACSSTTEQNCDFLMENNFHYSQDICCYCLEKGIRLILASSAATYGDGTHGFETNVAELSKLAPLNMYGYSKHLLDLWLVNEGVANDVVSLKFFNVYGPNEYHKGAMQSVVAKAYRQITETGRLKLFASTVAGIADGEQMRDFVYVKDCCRLMAWLLKHPEVNGIYNVGTGLARSFNALGKAVFAAMGREVAIDYIPMPQELVKNYQNFTCAEMQWVDDVHYPHSFVSLEEGVRDYVQNFLSHKDPYL